MASSKPIGWDAAIIEASLLQSYLREQPLSPTETGAARSAAIREVQKRIEHYKQKAKEQP